MAMTLITTNTSSNAASSSFTSSIDSTYKLFIFKFYDVNAATDQANLTFQVNATDGADYDDSLFTTTAFYARHTEADAAAFSYSTGLDLAQAASFQPLAYRCGNDADQSVAGELFLFNPSNTTYVKHWYARFQEASSDGGSPQSMNMFTAGYINDTTAIDDIQFKMSSGNMDAVIKMYGVG